MRKYKHLIPHYGLLILPTIALILYGYLGSFTRLLADDFCSIHYANRLGLLRSIWHWRLNWSGRYTAFGADWVMKKIGVYALPIIPPLSLLIWLIFTIITLYLLLRRVLSPDTLKPTALSLGTVFLFTVLVASPNVPHSLYWWNGMRSYSLPLILLTGYAILFQIGMDKLRTQRGIFAGIVTSFLLTFVIGGLGETYVAFQVALFTYLFALEWLVHKNIKSPVSLFLLAGLAGSMLSMFVVISAPGNAIRQSLLPPSPGIGQLFQLSFSGYLNFFIMEIVRVPEKIIGLAGAIIAAMWAGTQSENKQTRNHSITLSILAGSFILSFACIVPGVYGVSEPPPTRALIIPVFILAACLMYSGFIAGEQIVNSIYQPKNVNGLILILAILLVGYSALVNSQSLFGERRAYIEFAQKWDDADALILKAKADNLDSVQIPAMDNWAGLERPTPKKDYWPNICYSRYYDIQVYGPKYSESTQNE